MAGPDASPPPTGPTSLPPHRPASDDPPHDGRPPDYPPPDPRQAAGTAPTTRRTNGKAVAALAVSLLLGWVPFLGGGAAIVLGVMARREIERTGESGDGFALAAIILGVLGIVLWIAGIALLLGAFFALWDLGTDAPFRLDLPPEFERELERQLERELRRGLGALSPVAGMGAGA